MSSNEAGIVSALRNGNIRRAGELLLDCYHEEVFNYCIRLLGIPVAVTLYPRVLSSALEDLGSFDSSTTLRAWLYGIARRTILHYHRRNPSAFVGSHDASYVPTAGPEDAPGLRLTDDKLEECCTRLPSASLEILQLALWHSLTLAEIGHVVGLQQDRVRRLASDGLSLLSLALKRGALPPS